MEIIERAGAQKFVTSANETSEWKVEDLFVAG
jgi:hypothetical protein